MSLEAALLGQLELGLGELFDVDVLEGHHPHVLDEACRAVDIPDPRVGHRDVEVDLTALTAHLQVDGVGEVETPLGLNDVSEQPDDVAILAIELKLHLGLVLLQVLRAHCSPPRSVSTAPSSSIRGSAGPDKGVRSVPTSEVTPGNRHDTR